MGIFQSDLVSRASKGRSSSKHVPPSPQRRWINALYLCLLYLTVAAASFHGFYDKWGFRDAPMPAYVDEAHYSFTQMLDGSADRPFVYRRLLIQAAAGIESALSQSVKQTIVQRLERHVWWQRESLVTTLHATGDVRSNHLIAYCLTYYACFFFLFFSLLLGRSVCLELGMASAAAVAAPAIFALMLPYFFTMGGFFYDFPELFFLTWAALCALRGQWLPLLPLTAIAALSKESFLCFVPALYPLLVSSMGRKPGRLILLALMAIAAAGFVFVHWLYAHNPGQPEQFWFRESLHFYADFRNLFRFEDNYGIETPRGYSLLTFVVLSLVYAGAWKSLTGPMRNHIIIAACINIPLVLAFCGPGELRDFSLCYVGLLVSVGQNLANWLKTTAHEAQQQEFFGRAMYPLPDDEVGQYRPALARREREFSREKVTARKG